MLNDEMKKLIRDNLDDDILSVCVYPGYKGAIIVKIVSPDHSVHNRMVAYCSQNGINYDEKYIHGMQTYDLYALFGRDDIYELKS